VNVNSGNIDCWNIASIEIPCEPRNDVGGFVRDS